MTNEPSTHQVLGLGSSLAKGGWRSWWVTAQPESAGHICSNKGKADPELYPWSNTNGDKSCDHPTLHPEHSPVLKPQFKKDTDRLPKGGSQRSSKGWRAFPTWQNLRR